MLTRLVDECRDKLTPNEVKDFEKKVKGTRYLPPAQKWQVQTFNEQLIREGVSQGSLVAFERNCIHSNEDTPEKFRVYTLAEGEKGVDWSRILKF